jgi:uncharacterized protein (TIGR03663 family)
MTNKQKCCVLLLLVVILALGLRLPRLAERPMHGDEAIHAEKFGQLLEQGIYRYNPDEYHGPTLNYFTLIPAKLQGAVNLKQVNEETLRIVPVFFGVLLILLLWFLTDGLGTGATIIAGLLTAISPAMVFYSRYYIQEMLLVCFTFGLIACGYRYVQSKNIIWAISAGAFAGLMHATKETCIIAFASMVLAILLVHLLHRGQSKFSWKIWHIVAGIIVAVLVSIVFYSSFFTNPSGVTDSIKALIYYFARASENKLHIHPWYYYLQLLIYFKLSGGPVFSEALIVILAIVGFIAAMRRRLAADIDVRLARFIGFYTLIMMVSYSAIPYKTPWCMLSFLDGMILLAGIGAITIIKSVSTTAGRVVVSAVLTAAGAHLLWESYSANYKYYAEPVNPYVYAHPTRDIIEVANRVKEIALTTPQGYNLYIEVICTDNDYWPLPWYLRFFNNVGWWDKVDYKVPAAPIIIATADLENDILKLLYEVPPAGKRNLYVPLFSRDMYLRPNIKLLGFVEQELVNK